MVTTTGSFKSLSNMKACLHLCKWLILTAYMTLCVSHLVQMLIFNMTFIHLANDLIQSNLQFGLDTIKLNSFICSSCKLLFTLVST